MTPVVLPQFVDGDKVVITNGIFDGQVGRVTGNTGGHYRVEFEDEWGPKLVYMLPGDLRMYLGVVK